MAQYSVAQMYSNGRGVDKSLGKARHWYEQAAKQGIKKAEKALARLGSVPALADNEDNENALPAPERLRLAARQGDVGLVEALLKQSLNADEKDEQGGTALM
jgi:TPR repeat protein